ncbi:uncharacterized protein LOC115624232 [Scaptodrosophila lebanonensis]|uniref:Methylated-DNA--protein-cysteine methyltransferase n=1 Tax=Drosophila lebanonensis TaxID=7225 RepID=A0A6J2THV9_DROLE|nr:uncharacterized protein LOC115624232 [Scaptodrosophila lebanonensis]
MMWFNRNLRVSLIPLLSPPKIVKYGFVDAQFGRLLIGMLNQDQGAICFLYFVQKSDEEALRKAHQHWPKTDLIPDDVQIQKRCHKLFEAGGGDKENAVVLEVAARGTDFQLDVWNALVRMEMGSTSTYGQLAQSIGRPKAVRAVASAVASNEVSVLIPCHRIISKNGDVKYHWGAQLKRDLLSYEASK